MIIRQVKRTGAFGWLDQHFPAMVRRYPQVALKIKAAEDLLYDRWVMRKMQSRVVALAEEHERLFSLVEIETINRCNGQCGFCPVNAKLDPRPFHRMSDEMFAEIIRQLSEMKYSGRLSIFSNNEPLMDKRIVDFYRHARASLPAACLALITNGSLMTLDKLDDLCAIVDSLIIDNYSPDGTLNKTIAGLIEHMKHEPDRYEKVEVNIIRSDAFRGNRAGTAPNSGRGAKVKAPCLLPFIQCVIRPDGKVSLCCEDALGYYTMGDLAQKSLRDIWHGPEYERIRAQIKKGRNTLPLCNVCNSYWSLDCS